MCIIAAKYFESAGWVGVKTRDRNYKPTIRIRKSFRKKIERLYMWDDKTKYAEGVNEFGVAIISAATAVKTDEKEGGKNEGPRSGSADFYSPDGRRIRSALLEKTPELALKKLIEVEIPGNTFVFTSTKCYLLEGTFEIDPVTEKPGDYIYKTLEIKKDQTCVRTNHGVLLPDAGYQMDAEEEDHRIARVSSDARMKRTEEMIKNITDPRDMLDCISCMKNKNKQLNPIRSSKTHGKSIMVTTGQIMIVPNERTLHYRPIWSNTEVNIDSINSHKTKTFFEIASTRKLISFKESLKQ